MKKIIFMFLLFVSTLFANIGKITLLEGEAFVKRGEETLRLNISDQISNNDFIETKTNSKVKITFIDNTIITIGKESSLKIEDYFFDSNNKNSAKTELSVSKGAFHAITGQIGKVNPEKFKLKTPGREDDDEEVKLYTKKDYKDRKQFYNTTRDNNKRLFAFFRKNGKVKIESKKGFKK